MLMSPPSSSTVPVLVELAPWVMLIQAADESQVAGGIEVAGGHAQKAGAGGRAVAQGDVAAGDIEIAAFPGHGTQVDQVAMIRYAVVAVEDERAGGGDLQIAIDAAALPVPVWEISNTALSCRLRRPFSRSVWPRR